MCGKPTTRSVVLGAVLAALAALGLARRRRARFRFGPPDTGRGPGPGAGDREPRRPLVPSSSGAAEAPIGD